MIQKTQDSTCGPDRWNYTKSELASALEKAGLQRGDLVYSHISLTSLGMCKEMLDGQHPAQIIVDAMKDVIGPSGTFITPTYTYSFCRGETYDPDRSPSRVGAFGEWLRKQPGVARSMDPLFSCCGFGPMTKELFENPPHTCFGKDCLYERLEKRGAIICNIGVDLYWATCLYHLNWKSRVPYRYDKLFSGLVKHRDGTKREEWIYYVRACIDQSVESHNLNDLALSLKRAVEVPLGNGGIYVIPLESFSRLHHQAVDKDPWFTAMGPACDAMEEDLKRTGQERFDIRLKPDEDGYEIVRKLRDLPRDLISDATAQCFQAISKTIPLNLIGYPSGTPAGGYPVPERWILRHARLADSGGAVLLDAAKDPLACLRYSLPFKGTVSKDELLAHLRVSNPVLPVSGARKGSCWISLHNARDWGFACSSDFCTSLKDDRYQVDISSDFSFSQLINGVCRLEGDGDEEIVFVARMDGPFASGNVSGVAAIVEIYRHLKTVRRSKTCVFAVASGIEGITLLGAETRPGKSNRPPVFMLANICSGGRLVLNTNPILPIGKSFADRAAGHMKIKTAPEKFDGISKAVSAIIEPEITDRQGSDICSKAADDTQANENQARENFEVAVCALKLFAEDIAGAN
ncbi:MAG: DUF2172 domain-containing protein [Succinivibrionaceae bacterium]|nr:DUF2172 domain-containing protein [Succinivibrionaceae bacterium]